VVKDVNIHVKTTGAGQTRGELAQTARGVKGVGDSAEKTGTRTSRAFAKIKNGIGRLVGPLGIAAIAAAFAGAAVKMAKFFDELKKRTDEAVEQLAGVRQSLEDVFEAAGAFSEQSQAEVTKDVFALLKETSATQAVGVPVINAYMRQFGGLVESGQLSERQYREGLVGMLGYGERHGKEATDDLIALMAGWGMTTPGSQGEFRRTIAAGAQKSGLTDADLIGALGRGMPTVKAMGWTPEEAVTKIAKLASGEVGRKRMSLPGTTLDALMAPQVQNAVDKYAIAEDTVADPRALLAELTKRRQQMDPQAYTRMLVGIYGKEGAAGVHKLISQPRPDISKALAEAAGPEGLAAEQLEEQQSRETLLRLAAKSEATQVQDALKVKRNEQFEKEVRDIGEQYKKKVLRIRRPWRQEMSEWLNLEQKENELAAYAKWVDSLSAIEKRNIEERPGGLGLGAEWGLMTAEERFRALTSSDRVPTKQPVEAAPITPETAPQPSGDVSGKSAAEVLQGIQETLNNMNRPSVNHNYNNSSNYFPRVGPLDRRMFTQVD
jgi:hypothetical protein